MRGQFNFTVFGGLNKSHYERFRELRKKYGLDDRGMIECMIELALRLENHPDTGFSAALKEISGAYLITAPSDMPPLPEVI
jgi:hypothetical protein